MNATVSGGLSGTFGVFPAKDGRAVDKAALLAALDQQLGALDTPDSITMAVPVVTLGTRPSPPPPPRQRRRPRIE